MNHIYFSPTTALAFRPTVLQQFHYAQMAERCAAIARRKEFHNREQRQIKEKLDYLKHKRSQIEEQRRRILLQQQQQKLDHDEEYARIVKDLSKNYHGTELESKKGKLYKYMSFKELDEVQRSEERLERNDKQLENNSEQQQTLEDRIRLRFS
ncbi:unnamed protein product [Didymodactylos carnosus]|uniref:Uncharacterized protein n=1 Tax=Didymodactylos carnosus TaxID=1234261 RepID=A0A8S2F788_9BILA|nr:unnamed protein product [Didymodactylos carnosus]CAF4163841.1 unnamed protein product [Didymodactylos carnosus]